MEPTIKNGSKAAGQQIKLTAAFNGNFKELLAISLIVLAAATWSHLCRTKARNIITFMCDNEAVASDYDPHRHVLQQHRSQTALFKPKVSGLVMHTN